MKKIAAIALFLLAATGAWAAQKGPKPEMRLGASTRHGYAPVEVTLTGKISAIDQASLADCRISEEWTGDTAVSGLYPNTKRTMACTDLLDDGRIPLEFRRAVTLENPGVYSYRILVTPKGEKMVASQSIEVRAVRSPLEVGYTKSGTGPH